MTRSKPTLRAVLALALGVAALLALAGPAAAKDRNGDRIPDRWEKRHKLSLKVNQAHRDQDRDGLRNRAEFKAGTNPRDRDSDDDGTKDGDENAGTIASFDAETGKLTIALFGGDTIAGFVTEETRIECPAEAEEGATTSRHGDDDSSDESGESEPGDDNGGERPHGDESGRGSEHSGHGSGDCEHNECGTEALVEGAQVDEAELELSNGKAVFEKIELD